MVVAQGLFEKRDGCVEDKGGPKGAHALSANRTRVMHCLRANGVP